MVLGETPQGCQGSKNSSKRKLDQQKLRSGRGVDLNHVLCIRLDCIEVEYRTMTLFFFFLWPLNRLMSRDLHLPFLYLSLPELIDVHQFLSIFIFGEPIPHPPSILWQENISITLLLYHSLTRVPQFLHSFPIINQFIKLTVDLPKRHDVLPTPLRCIRTGSTEERCEGPVLNTKSTRY